MKLLSLNAADLQDLYGGRQAALFAARTTGLKRPFRGAVAILAVDGCSTMHAHLEGEIFVIMEGRARVETDQGSALLEGGDAAELGSLERHRVYNIDPVRRLLYLKLWWPGELNLPAADQSEPQPQLTIVTATPPTPNGDLHLGHISGPYLRADIFTRYLRMKGRPAIYLTGLDDHQSYVATKAASRGEKPDDTASLYGQMIEASWKASNIALDFIGKPRESKRHASLVAEVVTDLKRRGYIEERTAPALFCPRCKLSLFEAHVVGRCPHCGSPASGNACEVCCRPNDCHDLLEPRCQACGGKAVRDEYRRLFFRLSSFAPRLQDHLRQSGLPSPLIALAEQMLADGLPDISISHRSAWGLPVPVDGYSDQRLYVWFEMAAGYIAATQDLAAGSPERNELEVAWSTTQSKIVQFFGMDNGYFHVVLFPAIYMAMGNVANIPKFALTNEFLRLDGSKFSTSRSHAIWARDFLKQQPSDLVRYYLALAGPETSQTDFTVEAYSAEVERIRSSWRRWLSDLDAVVARSFGGCVPDLGLWLADHRAFLDELCGLHQSALAAYEHETFSPSRAVRCARELVHACGRFADGQRRLETIASLSAEWRTAVALQLAAARSLATIVAPVMPGFSANLRASLGCDGSGEPIETQPGFVQAGIQLGQLAAAVP